MTNKMGCSKLSMSPDEYKACCLAYRRRKYNENIDEARKHKRDYHVQHKQHINETKRRWHTNNKDKVSTYKRNYRQTDQGKLAKRNDSHKRRAIKKNVGKYTLREWISLCNTYGNICLSCKRYGLELTADHVMPLSKGGNNTIDNIQPLCRACNSKKHDKFIDFRYEIVKI